MAINQNVWLDEITYLRGVAILSVIVIHSVTYYSRINGVNFLVIFDVILDTFTHFAVPLFIFISGFTLYYKYSNNLSLKKFYFSRLKTILPPYCFFSLLSLLGILLMNQFALVKTNVNFLNIVFLFLTGGLFFHLWFIFLIIQFYFLFPVFKKLFEKNTSEIWFLTLMFISLMVQVIYNFYFNSDFLQVEGINLSKRVFIGYMFYFILGMYFSIHYEKFFSLTKQITFKFYLIVLILTLIQSYITIQYEFFGNENFMSIISFIQPIYYILIFSLCIKIAKELRFHNKKITEIVDQFGRNSYGIYLVHGYFAFLFGNYFIPLILKIDWTNFAFYPILFSLITIMSYITVYFIKKIPHYEYLIGPNK